jgi:hypothetical protein
VVIVPPHDASAEIGWTRVFDNGTDLHISALAVGNSILRLQRVGQQDAGVYRCYMTTESSGQQKADLQLVVVGKLS